MPHQENPRYFGDSEGNPVYLTGSHTWGNLQDFGSGDPPPVFDWDGYLDMLQDLNHNFIRLWTWEQACWAPWTREDLRFQPLPYVRTGPGEAVDGKPKFDLTHFDEAYFKRLRQRVESARARGIYVGIMLFQGWSSMRMDHGEKKNPLPGNPWAGHPFNRDNNINGIDGDTNEDDEGEEVHRLEVPEVTRLQEAYVREVVDIVNDLDNVLFEIGNEIEPESCDWQYHMIRYIQDYEKQKPFQHPVGMTSFYGASREYARRIFESPADWISPPRVGQQYSYGTDPPEADGQKVVLLDTDHIFAVGGDAIWVWKAFCRGHNPIYMDPLDDPTGEHRVNDTVRASILSARPALGQTRKFFERIDMSTVTPRRDESSTEYALVSPGETYLIFQPDSGRFTVDLGDTEPEFTGMWFDPIGRTDYPGPGLTGGTQHTVEPPFEGPAVLHLTRARDSETSSRL